MKDENGHRSMIYVSHSVTLRLPAKDNNVFRFGFEQVATVKDILRFAELAALQVGSEARVLIGEGGLTASAGNPA